MSNIKDYLKKLIDASGNILASVVEDGVKTGDFDSFIDTGSYVLNALLSGSIYGGVANNKITAFAGESATGKTFLLLSIVKEFLESDENSIVVYFDSESALRKTDISSRGINISKISIIPVDTIEKFRYQILSILDEHIKTPEDTRPKLMICLDSLGNLSTTKETEDARDGKEILDMSRARLIKGVFRILTLKLAQANVPLLVTNHSYLSLGQMFPQQIMGGGCLVAKTKIWSNKKLVDIESINVGDSVNTLLGDRKVLQTYKFDNKNIFEIEFSDGYKVKCSEDHKFLSLGGKWIAAKDINVGNYFLLNSKEYYVDILKILNRCCYVINIQKCFSEVVYDISVDEAEHYILKNGLIVHNSGLQYAASTIIFLSKKKEKDGDEVVGNIIHCKSAKNRLVKENQKVDILVTYNKGLNRYYGLVDLAIRGDLFKRLPKHIELPDGSKIFEKRINSNPTKYFTDDILKQLDNFAQKNFLYGQEIEVNVSEENDNEDKE